MPLANASGIFVYNFSRHGVRQNAKISPNSVGGDVLDAPFL